MVKWTSMVKCSLSFSRSGAKVWDSPFLEGTINHIVSSNGQLWKSLDMHKEMKHQKYCNCCHGWLVEESHIPCGNEESLWMQAIRIGEDISNRTSFWQYCCKDKLSPLRKSSPRDTEDIVNADWRWIPQIACLLR